MPAWSKEHRPAQTRRGGQRAAAAEKAERRDGKARPAACVFEGLLAWQTGSFHPKYQYECSPLKYVFAPLGICLIALYVLM